MPTLTKNGKVRFSIGLAIATHLNEDVATVERDHRYQPTRTPCPVYTVGNDYITASKRDGYPRPGAGWSWHRIPSRATRLHGWRIWQHKEKTR